jgi:hypothetical protein
MLYQFLILFAENQFAHPDPKGSELIFPAPFRVGVNRKNQFAD